MRLADIVILLLFSEAEACEFKHMLLQPCVFHEKKVFLTPKILFCEVLTTTFVHVCTIVRELLTCYIAV